jgi:hypothetical protein
MCLHCKILADQFDDPAKRKGIGSVALARDFAKPFLQLANVFARHQKDTRITACNYCLGEV